MTRRFALPRLRALLARFGRDEAGVATLEFVLMIPVVFGLLLLTLDSGFNTMRAALMNRALDMTARSIRTGTLASPTIGNIRTDLCSRLTFFPNCSTKLKVQITSVNRATFAMPSTAFSCADSGASITPVRSYVAGQTNGVAVLRACMEIDKFTPMGLIGQTALYKFQSSTVLAGSAS